MPDKNHGVPAEPNALDLDDQLCFALYVSSKELIRRYKPFLEPIGLTYTGYITMLALWERDNVPVNVLGERLTLDSGTLTPLLKKIEKLGYIERNRSRDDERTVIISLTRKGKELRHEAAKIPAAIYKTTKIDPANVKDLNRWLHQLTNYLMDGE